MNWYMEVLKKYAVFSGRARRTEYWMFVLFNFIISMAIGFIGRLLGAEHLMLGLSVVYSLVILLPGLAVLVRRLHDTGKSGGWFFICLVPLAGPIILLVFLASDSTPGDNQYGPNPKGV